MGTDWLPHQVIIIEIILCNTISVEHESACKNSSHFLFRGIKQRLFSFKFRSEKLTLLFSQQILVLCPEAPFGQWSQKRRLSFLPPARRELSAEQCLLPEGDRCRRGINWGLLIRRLNRKAVFDLVLYVTHYKYILCCNRSLTARSKVPT